MLCRTSNARSSILCVGLRDTVLLPFSANLVVKQLAIQPTTSTPPQSVYILFDPLVSKQNSKTD